MLKERKFPFFGAVFLVPLFLVHERWEAAVYFAVEFFVHLFPTTETSMV